MGPKAKNKKGDKKPVPEEDPNEIVTELMRQFFEIQLADISKKIDRLNERQVELKSQTDEIEEKIEEFKKEKGVIVTEHEQLLALKEEQKIQKREEMFQLSQDIKIRIANHKKHVEELEKRYTDMVNDYTSQIDVLEDEMKTLDEFKQNTNSYMEQLNELEAQIEHAEIEHQRSLFSIESKCQLATARVKKELESKLLQLSIEFQQISQKKTGPACHRVTQENKAIETELRLMESEILEYREQYKTLLSNLNLIKNQEDMKRMEKDKAIARTVIQGVVIKNLVQDRIKILEKLRDYAAVEVENKLLTKKLRMINIEIEKKDVRIEEIKRHIDSKIDETGAMNEAVRHLKRNSRRLLVLIRNALKIAEEGLAVRLIPMGGMEEEKFMNSDAKIRLFKKRRDSVYQKKGRILQYLLDVLAKAQMSDEDKKLLRASSEVSSDSIELDQINFSIIYGLEKDSETEPLVTGTAEADKTSTSLGSDVSLPRSVSMAVLPASEMSRTDSDLEEYGEDYGEQDIEEMVKKEVVEQESEKKDKQSSRLDFSGDVLVEEESDSSSK